MKKNGIFFVERNETRINRFFCSSLDAMKSAFSFPDAMRYFREGDFIFD